MSSFNFDFIATPSSSVGEIWRQFQLGKSASQELKTAFWSWEENILEVCLPGKDSISVYRLKKCQRMKEKSVRPIFVRSEVRISNQLAELWLTDAVVEHVRFQVRFQPDQNANNARQMNNGVSMSSRVTTVDKNSTSPIF